MNATKHSKRTIPGIVGDCGALSRIGPKGEKPVVRVIKHEIGVGLHVQHVDSGEHWVISRDDFVPWPKKRWEKWLGGKRWRGHRSPRL